MAIALLVLASIVYLAFVFPEKLAMWAEQERALTVSEQLFANLSSFCTSFGFFLVPFFCAVFIGCGIWMKIAVHRNSTQPVNYRER